MPAAVRNVLIILVLALALWRVPGGGTAGATIWALLTLILIGGLMFFAARMYLEHRVTIDMLPDRSRMILYGAVGVLVVAMAATGRLWNTGGGGVLLWFALIGLAAYGLYSVWRQNRAY